MTMRRTRAPVRWYPRAAVALVLAAGLAVPVLAQGGLDLRWHTVDGGGGTMAAGGLTLRGTVGQHDTGRMSGGPLTLTGGFWPGVRAGVATDPVATDPVATATRTATPPATWTPRAPGVRDVLALDNRFEPATVEIAPGDTVRWTNLGQVPHTTTSDDGLWDSPFLGPQETFEHTFADVGRYPYFCRVHPTAMRGTVVVNDGSLPPDGPRIYLPMLRRDASP